MSKPDDRECAYCGLGSDCYHHVDEQYRDDYREWYQRSDGEWAHRGCSPTP